MPRKVAPLIPATEELLNQLGERLRLARLRRHLTARQVAERAGMAPMTLRSLERGSSAVTMGAYAAVMQILGMESDLNLVAQADPTGRSLQDARLRRRHATRTVRKPTADAAGATASGRDAVGSTQRNISAAVPEIQRPGEGFTNTRDLADLLEVNPTRPAKEGREQ